MLRFSQAGRVGGLGRIQKGEAKGKFNFMHHQPKLVDKTKI